MSPCYPFRPIPGQCGPHRRGPIPAPPFDPQDYWATRKLVSSLFGSLDTKKLDKVDVVDPSTATEDGKAADAKSTYEELTRISGMASDAKEIAESKADLVGGKVPAAQLPSYVDDVLEYDTVSAFPAIGESGKIYVAKDANKTYRWSGTQYIEIGQSPILDDTVTEKSPNGVKSSGIWSAIWGTLAALPAGFTSIYDWCADKIKAIEESLAGLDKSKLDANKGLNFAPSKYSEYNAVEIVNGWWLAVIGGFGNIWDVTSDGRMRQSLSSALNGKADKLALDTHVLSNENPHGVTAKQIGAVPLVEDSSGNKTAVTIGLAGTVGQNSLANGDGVTASGECSHAEGEGTTASGYCSHAEGAGTTAAGKGSHAEGKNTIASGTGSHTDGINSRTRNTDNFAFAWNGDDLIPQYTSHGPGTFNINPVGGLDGFYIGGQKLAMILSNKSDEITRFTWTSEDPNIPDGWIDLANSPSAPQPYFAGGYWSCGKIGGCEVVSLAQGTEDDLTFTLDFADFTVEEVFSATATRKRVLRTGDAATPQDLTDAISTNNPAFVSAVQNTPTSGMPEDTPTDWGAFGTVGAALAALAAGLKWCKNILGSLASGYSTFAAWIASKLDRASLLTEYSATSAYSVGAFVCHDGIIYQCKTAIADGGEAWNAEHWELRKLEDFFTESNSLLNGRLAYSRNATGLKDRAFNALTFDGTE